MNRREVISDFIEKILSTFNRLNYLHKEHKNMTPGSPEAMEVEMLRLTQDWLMHDLESVLFPEGIPAKYVSRDL